MKVIVRLLILPLLLLGFSCNDGYIDEISKVDPGADESAPVITMKFPAQGTKIKVGELVTSIGIDFEVSDDIEVKTISVSVDGNDVGTLTEFLDYRKVVVEDLMYAGLENGQHTLTITATDVDNKTTTATAEFEKAPPYVPVYAGEIFYMSFDSDVAFKELVTFSDPTVVGAPTLAGQGASGGNAYAGKEDSYLKFPTTALTNDEFSAVFWMKVNNSPDRAGILVMGPPGPDPIVQNNRTSGFRFFREDAGGKQRFKLNVGDGTTDYWVDGGALADVTPNTDEWVSFAFTISASHATVYIDGEQVAQGAFPGIDWTGVDILSIMSGEPRFNEWGHKSDKSLMDELRIFNKALSAEEIQTIIDDRYEPYDGEELYFPFNGSYNEFLSGTAAQVVGSPDFAGEGVKGDAYAGAAGSYLTYPTTDLHENGFSAAFWMKINDTPDRAGILVMGPPDPNLPDTPNNRKAGFRFFRETNGSGKQRFKLNVGDGTTDHWFDGGANADVDPADGWVHLAFTISGTQAAVYINGEVASQGALPGLSWEGCDILSIMSGAPRFTEWNHLSDESFMDELHIFSKALSQAEVQAVMDGN
ncbi:MAG TPA: LamG-like jellyroll fold domain-containing protein [Ohtaekwangia sp.]|nr:LamG-like jellyroll fold domain-containing protein [Ohtaekwangia sp.]